MRRLPRLQARHDGRRSRPLRTDIFPAESARRRKLVLTPHAPNSNPNPDQVPLDTFGPWEEAGHPPEAEFLEKLKKIDGVSQVETQTMTNQVL